MTGQELSTAARYGLNPIIFVLNNKGYTTDRFIHEGPYNDVHEWAYHLMPQVLRKGWGCEVRTEGELEDALVQAKKHHQLLPDQSAPGSSGSLGGPRPSGQAPGQAPGQACHGDPGIGVGGKSEERMSRLLEIASFRDLWRQRPEPFGGA